MTRLLRGLLLFAIPGCGIADVTPLPGTTPQVAKARSAFAVISVRVTDASGAPVDGADVQYYDSTNRTQALVANDPNCFYEFGSGYYCYAKTGSDGVAVLPPLAGRIAGVVGARVGAWKGQTSLGTVPVDLRVEPAQAPAILQMTQGADQRVEIGTLLSPLAVRLTTPSGAPLSGQTLYLSPFDWNTSNRGGFEGAPTGADTVTTGADGIAHLPPLRAGWGVGPQAASAFYIDEPAGAAVELAIRYTAINAAGQETLALQDLWWGGPSENGWGVSITQHGDRLFNVFYVYDDDGQPTWFVQPGGTWRTGLGSTLLGKMYTTRGTPWFAYDASRLTAQSQEQGYVHFSGPQRGRIDAGYSPTGFRYTWKEIVRQDFRRAGTVPSRGLGDMWWGGPAQNGWGLAIHEQDGNLFIVWFTYDEQGRPIWFVMPDGSWSPDSSVFSGAIYRTRSSAWFGASYNPSRLNATAVGEFRLRFDGTQRATLEYTLEGRSGALDLERQPF